MKNLTKTNCFLPYNKKHRTKIAEKIEYGRKINIYKRTIATLVFTIFTLTILAQTSFGISYEQARHTPAMQWVCPEIENNLEIISSAQNDDYKIFANNLKNKFKLQATSSEPDDKYIFVMSVIEIINPMFNPDDLLSHICNWLKKQKVSKQKIDIDKINKKITSSASINIATHSTFLYNYKAYINPTLIIQLQDNDKLIVSLALNGYTIEEFGNGSNQNISTQFAKVSDVFPFAPKSSYKITFAKSYVSSYYHLWDFMRNLREDLNTNFTKDQNLLTQLHYEFSKDSLFAKYGEPTKVIAYFTDKPDINKEMRFYEKAQKLVFMGRTIDFKDIISCIKDDDPSIVPGKSTTYGTGISIFGIGLGGSTTKYEPGKTIHHYVVKVIIDNLRTPYIYVATGQDDNRANELYTTFEYILRHQNKNKGSISKKRRTPKRKGNR